MTEPVRVQLRRTKGWKLQEASIAINGLPAVKVDRTTMWGNPYAVLNDGPEGAVELFRRLFDHPPSRYRHLVLAIASARPGFGEGALLDMKLALPSLRGKNLACWCKPGEPCHADVLLELANSPSRDIRG